MENNFEYKVGAIIIAAGKSSRMGDFKPLLRIEGTSAVEREVKTLQSAGIKDIVLVAGHLSERLVPIADKLGIEIAVNEGFLEGMFTSIQKGFNAQQEKGFTGIFLLPVDCPLIPKSVICEMIKVHKENKDKLIVPCFRGKKGHPLFLPWHLADEILKFQAKGGLKTITDKYEEDIIRLETNTEAVILDMDTPEGYEEILQFNEKDESVSIKEILKNSSVKRIIMVRHGQPKQHGSPIFLGQTDIPLSESGKAEILKTREKFWVLSPKSDTLYSSDLSRAVETAEIIKGAKNVNVKIQKIQGFREINLGDWDGKLIKDIKNERSEDFEKRGKNLLTFKKGHSSENFYDLQYRVLKTLEKIVKNHKDEDLIIVSHAGVIRVIYANLMETTLEESLNLKIDTGEINTICL